MTHFDHLSNLCADLLSERRHEPALLHLFRHVPAGAWVPFRYEHAFYIDYQNKKADYVDKFLQFLDWGEADRRYRTAGKG